MKRVRFIVLFGTVLSSTAAAYALDSGRQQTRSAAPAGSSSIQIQYRAGRLTADVHDARLDDLLEVFEAQTGVEAELTDPRLAPIRLSATVEADSLEEGLKYLLQGYSYALYRVGTQQSRRLVLVSASGAAPPRRVVSASAQTATLPNPGPEMVEPDAQSLPLSEEAAETNPQDQPVSEEDDEDEGEEYDMMVDPAADETSLSEEDGEAEEELEE
jgi:hypothetical protein